MIIILLIIYYGFFFFIVFFCVVHFWNNYWEFKIGDIDVIDTNKFLLVYLLQ